MNIHRAPTAGEVSLGVGYYTAPEAGRLLGIPARNVRRWLTGYSYRHAEEIRSMPALWSSQLPVLDRQLELGFRDLIELKFVKAFIDAGLSLITIRHCLEFAKKCVHDERPFSTKRFRTDGRTIFLESVEGKASTELLDLRTHQYQLGPVIERTFRDLDIEADIVSRWRPFEGKRSIIVDPGRAFGQPIATDYGVPTEVLADAVKAEGSIEAAARIFEVEPAVVKDSINFEARLRAA
jgi:uncharacterized protein (DUF433 family)